MERCRAKEMWQAFGASNHKYSCILQAHHSMSNGITLRNPTGTRVSQCNNDMYVDGTNNWAETPTHTATAATTAVRKLQVGSGMGQYSSSHRRLHCFPKCRWSALTWNYNSSPPHLLSQPPSSVSLKDSNGASTIISKTSASTPNVGLGHRMAPNGSQSSEFIHRLKQCRDMARQIVPANLTLEESHLMIVKRIIPKVT